MPSRSSARRRRCVLVVLLAVLSVLISPRPARAQPMVVTGVSGATLIASDEETGDVQWSVAFTVRNAGAQSAYLMSQGNCGPFVRTRDGWCPGASWQSNGLVAAGQTGTASVIIYVPGDNPPNN